jgi:hypothetical protein
VWKNFPLSIAFTAEDLLFLGCSVLISPLLLESYVLATTHQVRVAQYLLSSRMWVSLRSIMAVKTMYGRMQFLKGFENEN